MALPRYCLLCARHVRNEKFRDGAYDPTHSAITGYCCKHSRREIDAFETALQFKRFVDQVYQAPVQRYIRSAKLIPIESIPRLLDLTVEDATHIWDGRIEAYLISAVREYRTLTEPFMWEIADYIDERYGRQLGERLRKRLASESSQETQALLR